jgi:hypothetical protein
MLAMRGAKTFREQGSNSSYGQRQPGVISTDSIGRFRQVLSPNQIAFIQNLAGNEMVTFDYELDAVERPFSQRLRFSLFDWPLNLFLSIAWHVRYHIRQQTKTPLPAYRIVTDM